MPILTNFTNYTTDFSKSFYSNVSEIQNLINIECENSLECVYAKICPQLTTHFITTGIIILSLYVVTSWVTWWFFKYGYKRYNFKSLENEFNRLWWHDWIKARFLMIMTLYIVMVIWFNINIKF